MLPIGDDQIEGGPGRLVTIALVAANVLAFFLELNQSSEAALQSFVQAWASCPGSTRPARTSFRTSRCPSGARC